MRTLEDVVQACRLATPDNWPDQVYARYLDPALVNSLLLRRSIDAASVAEMSDTVAPTAVALT